MDGHFSICNALLPEAAGLASYIPMGGFSIFPGWPLNTMQFHNPLEIEMPQNSKDSKGGKPHPVKETSQSGGKNPGKGSADQKTGSPAGSQTKGEKKTTP